MLRLAPSVESARAERRPIVALESSVLAQGLPIPQNREAFHRMSRGVAMAGAQPAVIAVARGQPVIGLEGDDLERFLARTGVQKLSARDLGLAMARGLDGATTVAGTLALARLAGIEAFATGGIGGVHRTAHGARATDGVRDESADLLELARSRAVVVCSGAKSILDLPATWERLETLGIPVVGYCTGELPGFFTAETGIRLGARADSASELAAIARDHWAVGNTTSLLVVQAPPPGHALSRALIDAAIDNALAEAERKGIQGGEVTPFLLEAVSRLTNGRSLATNLALLEANATLAAHIARAL